MGCPQSLRKRRSHAEGHLYAAHRAPPRTREATGPDRAPRGRLSAHMPTAGAVSSHSPPVHAARTQDAIHLPYLSYPSTLSRPLAAPAQRPCALPQRPPLPSTRHKRQRFCHAPLPPIAPAPSRASWNRSSAAFLDPLRGGAPLPSGWPALSLSLSLSRTRAPKPRTKSRGFRSRPPHRLEREAFRREGRPGAVALFRALRGGRGSDS